MMKLILSEDKFHKDIIEICNTPVNTHEFLEAIKCASEENLKIALKLLEESPARTKKKQDMIKHELLMINDSKCVNHNLDDLWVQWDEVVKKFKRGVVANA